MVNKSLGMTLILFIFFLCYCATLYSQDEYVKSEAMSLINRYFYALKNGETNQLMSMMAESYKKKHQELLDNNRYAEFLREINADLTFEIGAMSAIDEDKIAVDIITTRKDSIEKLKLFLMREDQIIKIYDEQLVP